MSKLYLKEKHIRSYVHSIVREMAAQNWRPDYIVGITRGGLIPAVMFSHYLDVPMHTLKVSLRDDDGPESNLWMAEDAFAGKNILIVDDINDAGSTLNWIKEDWPSGCFPNDDKWSSIWNHNVRFAVMINNAVSQFRDADYFGMEINKHETPCWVVFPWENWWEC